jgi:CheY-like chemotaxis protein
MGDVQTTKRIEESIGWSRTADEVTSEGSKTILFLEDEAFVRDVTCEVLRSAGYLVLSAKNALEAERAYDQSSDEVDLLLADVVLPGETGRMFAVRLRRKNPALKVLLVTGYGEQMGTREGSQEECLAKPFSAEVLLRRVRQRLDSGERPIANEDSIRHACDNA